tara:strand:- start:1281 stop:1454 length:174 start_codon:yes stop_codon:yes gene_type:complete
MEYSSIDLLYMFLIGGLYAGFLYMEVQISQIKAMMEEHVKCDDSIKELSKKYHKKES